MNFQTETAWFPDDELETYFKVFEVARKNGWKPKPLKGRSHLRFESGTSLHDHLTAYLFEAEFCRAMWGEDWYDRRLSIVNMALGGFNPLQYVKENLPEDKEQSV